MSFKNRLFKRLFDVCFSFVGLFFTFPIILVSLLWVVFDTKSNGIFAQERIGRNGRVFKVFKIKTMKNLNFDDKRTSITANELTRVTKSGTLFRKYKIDELPQLWNVLIGDMSFVGPRPDVSGYADYLIGEDKNILILRPGITGPASIKYKNEEYILSRQIDPQSYNDTVIWPDKVKINLEYLNNYSFFKDLGYIIKTIKG